MEKEYQFYKTTNLINNKFYYGVHVQKKIDDGYLGSGNLLNLSIKKYGRDNFRHTVLAIFDTEDEMYEYEKWFIDKEMVANPLCYNIAIGGRGAKENHLTSEETRKKISKGHKGKKLSNETKKKISQAQKGKQLSKEHIKNRTIAQTGLKRTEETKMKIGNANRGRIMSEKQKLTMSKLHKGYVTSEETKLKLSITGKKKPPVTNETRAKISKIHKGKKVTVKTIAKMILTRARNRRNKYIKQLPTIKITHNYDL